MLLTKRSMFTNKEHTLDIPITGSEYERWLKEGRFTTTIQNYFPQLTDGQREFLLSGATEEEWDNAFREPDDEYQGFDGDFDEAPF